MICIFTHLHVARCPNLMVSVCSSICLLPRSSLRNTLSYYISATHSRTPSATWVPFSTRYITTSFHFYILCLLCLQRDPVWSFRPRILFALGLCSIFNLVECHSHSAPIHVQCNDQKGTKRRRCHFDHISDPREISTAPWHCVDCTPSLVLPAPLSALSKY